MASSEELDWLLTHAKDYDLQSWEEHGLREMAVRIAAERHSAAMPNHAEHFLVGTLGILKTPFGDLSAAEVELLQAIRLRATRAIQECDHHQKERCRCWRDARDQLFELRRRHGEKSPVGFASLAAWNSIEQLARTRGDRNAEPHAPPEATGMSPYNWRYYKCPDYRRQY